MVVDAMTCEACEAETQARLIARGKRSATPGCRHPHHLGIRIGCELHIINGHIRLYARIAYAPTFASDGDAHPISGDINRGAVTTSITPHWRRQATMWGHAAIHTIHNRGAVADPAH